MNGGEGGNRDLWSLGLRGEEEEGKGKGDTDHNFCFILLPWMIFRLWTIPLPLQLVPKYDDNSLSKPHCKFILFATLDVVERAGFTLSMRRMVLRTMRVMMKYSKGVDSTSLHNLYL